MHRSKTDARRAPSEGRGNRNQISRELAADTRIPRVTSFGNEFPISVFLAVALAIVVAVLITRSVPGFSVSIGWTGLLVALVARERPIAAIVVAFVFGALRTGSQFVAATGVERRITDVVQALLTLALLVPPALLYIRERRRALAATRERT